MSQVWQNKAYTFKSDVWAVGCVLYEMITLAVPFGGCSLPDLRAKVRTVFKLKSSKMLRV